MRKGWVKLYRSLIDDKTFGNPEILKLWILCLLKANHKEAWVDIADLVEPVHVKPGQFITGRNKLYKDYYKEHSISNKSDRTLWRYLKLLEKWGSLSINSTTKYSIVTINNWRKYQVDDSSDQQMPNSFPAGDKRVSTNKNENNNKNEKKKYTSRGTNKYNNQQASRVDQIFDRFEELFEES